MNAHIAADPGTYVKRPFSSQDNLHYRGRLAHFREKVLCQGEVLTPEERSELHGLVDELLSRYDGRTLAEYGILSLTGGISALTRIRIQGKLDDALEDEDHRLSARLRDDDLVPAERERILSRIDEIRYSLDPWHYHRVKHG